MRTARRISTLLTAVAMVAACSDESPVRPLDENLTLDQEAELALDVLADELATEAALALAEASAPAALRAGRGAAHETNAASLANQARTRFRAALQSLGEGERLEATIRAREARRLVVRAMVEAEGPAALQAALERIDDLEESVRADPEYYEEVGQLMAEMAMLRATARNQWARGDREGAAATGVLAEQRHRHRYRMALDSAARHARAELMVEFASTAVSLATRLLNAAGGPDDEQAVFLAVAEEHLALAERALAGGNHWRAIHLAHVAQWMALKAVVLPGGVTDEEARALYELAVDLHEQAVAAVGDDPTTLQASLLRRVERLIANGVDKLSDGVTRGIAAFWQAAVISTWLLG